MNEKISVSQRRLWAGAAALVGICLIGGVLTLQYLERSLVTAAGQSLTLAASDIADKLDMQLVERMGDLRLISQSLVLQGQDYPAVARRLDALVETYPVYRGAVVTDATGRILAASNWSSQSRDLSKMPAFRTMRAQRRIVVQDVALDDQGVRVVTFFCPLIDAGGAVRGAVVSQVGLPALEDAFVQSVLALQTQWGTSAHMEYVFLDQQGGVFVDSVLREEGQVNLRQAGLRSAQLLEVSPAGFVEEVHGRRQVPVLTGYAQTRRNEALLSGQWGVLVRVDRSDVLAPIRAVQWDLGAAGLGIVAPLVASLIWGLRRFAKVTAQRERLHREIQLLLDSTVGGLYGVDRAGRCTFINRTGADLLGYQPEELQGRNLHELVHYAYSDGTPYPEEENFLYRFAWSGAGSGLREEVCWRRDGTAFQAELTAQPVYDAGVIKGAVVTFTDLTARLQREATLRQLAERLELATSAAQMGVWDWNLRQGVLEWDDRMLALYGLERHQFAGDYEAWLTSVHCEDRARCEADLHAALRHDRPCILEFRVCWPDGTEHSLQTQAQVSRAADGTPVRMTGISYEVTARKRLEAEAQAMGDWQRAVMDYAGHAIISTTPDGLIQTFNPAAERMLGYKAADLVQKASPAIFHDLQEVSDRARMFSEELGKPIAPGFEVFVAKARNNQFNEYEWTYIRKDGTRLFVLLSVTALRNSTGHITGFLGLALDITKRKEAERALAQQLQALADLKAALDAHAIVAVTDQKGRIVALNDKFCRISGYTREELLGQDHRMLNSGYHPKAFVQELWRTIANGGVWSGEIRNRAKDGALYWVATTIVPFLGADQKPFQYIAIRTDITARKHAEASLLEAKERAEVSTRAKSEFLAMMSHEIRTPMNGVIGMAGLLLDTDLTPDQQELVGIVRSSGDHLLTIINDILDFSKIEAGKLVLEMIEFDLRIVVAETVELVADRAFSNGLNLAYLVHEAVPVTFRGDPGRFRQILLNLVSNAIKFTTRGEVVVTVTLDRQDEVMATVRVAVQDTGIGLSQASQAQLFQPFMQADSSTTRKYGGTGLGLAICKQLTELMGGQLGVDSRVGEGSTFWFTVPLNILPPARSSALVAQDLQGLHLCIVESQATNRRILQHYVERWGVGCVLAEDGPQALKLMHNAAALGQACDLAIIALQLPGMDGLELARAIQADPALARTRLVGVTRQSERGNVRVPAAAAGYVACLNAPIRESSLYACLTSLRNGSAGWPARPAPVTQHRATQATRRVTVRILVADDNVVNQKIAAGMLQKLGYQADVVANGLEALEALARIPYAAVLMDCQMPELDGFDATREIRRREEARAQKGEGAHAGAIPRGPLAPRHVPIIAMTANVQQEDRDRCIAAGMDDYVSKPVDPAKLAEVLARVVLCAGGFSAITWISLSLG